MAIISVEVDDKIAKKFSPYTIVPSHKLIETIEDTQEEELVNFGEKGVSAKEVLSYLKDLK